MPLYEYRCSKCNEEFEELVAVGSDETPPCPKCSSTDTHKKISLFGGIGGAASCGSSGFT
jgi:putative FmdB family regulatory protein